MVAVCEQGFAGTSVSAVCARAGVSLRSFYECFGGREECFLAVIDDAYRQGSAIMADSYAQAGDWREGLRDALAGVLVPVRPRAAARTRVARGVAGGRIVGARASRRVQGRDGSPGTRGVPPAARLGGASARAGGRADGGARHGADARAGVLWRADGDAPGPFDGGGLLSLPGQGGRGGRGRARL